MNLSLRYRYDDSRLRERALLELARALRNDRLVAITGSMSDEALGYFSWTGFQKKFAAAAKEIAGQYDNVVSGHEAAKTLVDTICGQADRLLEERTPVDPTVRFGVIRDCFEELSRLPTIKREVESRSAGTSRKLSPLEQFRTTVAELFRQRHNKRKPRPAAIRPLIEDLGLFRIATLNYDFELERAFMLRRDERCPRFLDRVGEAGSGRPVTCNRIGTMHRSMGDGMAVESDVVDRERPDRLLEFAIGSPTIDRHILHLHGRADRPETMVVTVADYDLRYRRDDLFRNPFEHGMRVLFAGNPVLFVGLGMNERELNDFLRYFVSNTPYRRMAPAFLIWNTLEGADREPLDLQQLETYMKERRLDFLQRLGVHVIFDEDLLGPPIQQFGGKDDRWLRQLRQERRAVDEKDADGKQDVALKALRATLERIPAVAAELKAASTRSGDGTWRGIGSRILPAKPGTTGSGQPDAVRLWGTLRLQGWASEQRRAFETSPGDGAAEQILVGIFEPGSGRGGLAEELVQQRGTESFKLHCKVVQGTRPDHRLLVNAGFSYDSDAMLNTIASFLFHRLKDQSKPLSRERDFADGRLFDTDSQALVIINGIDRFFAFDGQPLSAELDHLFRCVKARPREEQKVQWLLLGTERISKYADQLGLRPFRPARPSNTELARPEALSPIGNETPLPRVHLASCYLDNVSDRFSQRASEINSKRSANEPCRSPRLSEAAIARIREAAGEDRSTVRRAFFGGFLAPPLMQSLGFECPVVFEVLRTMAFIGSPVEAEVLLHAPKIRIVLDECCELHNDPALVLRAQLAGLEALGLIVEIAHTAHSTIEVCPPSENWKWRRYGLHRSLANELRERHGAPVSEAKLAATFNMSLFVAQATDSYMPKESFHDELGELVDRLAGAWKDEAPEMSGFPVSQKQFLETDSARTLLFRPVDGADAYEQFRRLCLRRSSVCLRAALAVVRGYYSTSGLLTLGRHSGLVAEGRDGALTEHADRLDRLLKTFGKIATARKVFRDATRSAGKGPETQAGEEHARRWLGPEPLYADDLVWLHNERGVVKLAQGHLYDARRSFRLAADANNRHVEHGYPGHNWRRITMNEVGLLIERGRLDRAERRLDAIEASVDTAPWAEQVRGAAAAEAAAEDAQGPQTMKLEPRERVRRILDAFGKDLSPPMTCGTWEFTREEMLFVALATSYRGLIAHMRGQYRDADSLYALGTRMLRHLRETRAYSIFQRHLATLGPHLGTRENALREAELAVAAADAVKQLDVAHRARIVRASQVRSNPDSGPEDRRMALQQLHRALDYAAATDAYRVRIEASSSLAKQMRESGDYDAALRYASDALAIACRYGHSLHKISLRVEIGRILVERGDPISGDALLQSALEAAMLSGYHRTVERVQRARQVERPPPPAG